MEDQTKKAAQLAVITGASSGIGFNLATQFLENGFDVLICAEDERIYTAAENLPKTGKQIEAFKADLATHEGIENFFSKIKSLNRPVDALAINAGVGVGGKFATETDLKDELNLINLNIMQPVHLSKLVLKDMVARKSGKILFTASVAGTMPGPLYAVYAASKAFVLSFAEALRNELKDSGITVTALLPGATDTEFFERAGMENTRVGVSDKKDDPADVAREAFEALMAGKEKVVTGFINKVQTLATRVMPDSVKAALHRTGLEPAKDSQKETKAAS